MEAPGTAAETVVDAVAAAISACATRAIAQDATAPGPRSVQPLGLIPPCAALVS
jgi:hypothetical protein